MSAHDPIDDLICTRVGRFWHFSDGTILPVVSGGDGPVEEDAATETAESAEAATETVETTEADPFDDESTTTFSREYVQKLRKENATYRERAKTFESAFDGYSDEAREFVLSNLVPSLVSDYEGTIKALASELGITQAEAEKVVEEETGVTGEEEKPLTRAEAEALWAEREAAREAEREAAEVQKAIVAEAKELGYDPDAAKGTLAHARFLTLLTLARDAFDSDIAKAHEALEAERQALIAEHVEKIAAENGKAPAPVRSGGVGGQQSGPPKTLAEARAAMSATLDAQGYPKSRG